MFQIIIFEIYGIKCEGFEISMALFTGKKPIYIKSYQLQKNNKIWILGNCCFVHKEVKC